MKGTESQGKNSKLYSWSWNVAYRKKPQGSIFSDLKTEWTVIPNSMRYWTADPFIIEFKNEIYVFAEMFDYFRQRGVLGYYQITAKNPKWIPVIVESYHLSYPYIFIKDNEIFMVPDASGSNNLYIYHAKRFPDKWEKVGNLRPDKYYADTSVLVDIDAEPRYAFSFDLEDPLNPRSVLLNIESAEYDMTISEFDNQPEVKRPAGKTFVMKGKLIRPAQYSVGGYGKALLMYEYRFENGQFLESLIKKIEPENLKLDKKMVQGGIHTYNATENYEVVDIKTRRFNLFDFIYRIIDKIKRVRNEEKSSTGGNL